MFVEKVFDNFWPGRKFASVEVNVLTGESFSRFAAIINEVVTLVETFVMTHDHPLVERTVLAVSKIFLDPGEFVIGSVGIFTR